jgi:hypothetical protein
MPESVNVEEIIKNNRSVDPAVLAEIMKLYKELLESGLPMRGYRLIPPYGGRRIIVGDADENDDPRTKHLST